MTDVFFTLPTNPTTPSGPAAVSAALQNVKVETSPPSFQQWANQQFQQNSRQPMDGQIMGRNPDNNMVQVQTDKGVINLRLPPHIPVGSQVRITVSNLGPPLQINVARIGAQAGTQATQAGTQAAPAATTNLSTGTNLAANVTGPGTAAGNAPALPQGASLQVRLVNVQPPQAATLPQGTAATGQGAAAQANPGAANPAPTNPAALPGGQPALGGQAAPANPAAAQAGRPPPNLFAGNQANPAPTPPANPTAQPANTAALAAAARGAPPAIPAALANNVLTGTVTGTALGGQTVVQTPAGQLTFPQGLNAPVGSTVTLLLPASTPTAGQAPQIPMPPAALDQDWPALRTAMDQLAAANPSMAQSLVNNAIPQPGGDRFAAQLLFFMVAVKGGNIRSWLGDSASSALERLAGPGGRNALASLRDDFGRLRKMADGEGGDWKSFHVPVMDDGRLDQLGLHVRTAPQEDPERDEDGEPGKRFVMEMEFSRTGPIQLDGFLHEKRFDLIIRTKRALTGDMRKDINTMFADAVAPMGLAGRLTFEVTSRFPQPVQKQTPPSGGGGSITV